MPQPSRESKRLAIIAVALIVVMAGAIVIRGPHSRKTVPAPSHVAKAAPKKHIVHSATASLKPMPRVEQAYMDVVRAAYPRFPATQPLGVPLELSQAAHLVLPGPIYLGAAPRALMWITRSDAPPIEEVLKSLVDPDRDADVIVTRRRVAFVHWMPDDSGIWPPFAVCALPGGKYEVVSAAYGRQPLPARAEYRWDQALSWNELVIVPSTRGVSIFRFGPRIEESYHELAIGGSATGSAEPRFLLDGQGVVAWIPWDSGKTGGLGAARFVPASEESSATRADLGAWTDLSPSTGWPERIVQLVPLLDGTVLMMALDAHGAVQLGFNTLRHANVDPKQITALVEQLDDADQAVRQKAFDQLSQYGSGIWPMLEKLLDDQGPEAQLRMRQLLSQKVRPTLNGMSLLGKKSLRLMARLGDGGTVFLAQDGVSIPNPDEPDAAPQVRVPAWISIRPGRPIELLPTQMTQDLQPGKSRLFAIDNDWIITGDARGGRWFVGNGFVNLLRKNEQQYSSFVGEDHRGRWLFRMPGESGAGSPATATSQPGDRARRADRASGDAGTTRGDVTLILDPTLPDPTPRLPVWVIRTAKEVGWTKQGWPVIRNGSAYALQTSDWVLVDEKEHVYTRASEAPPPIEPEPTQAAAAASAAALPASAAARPLHAATRRRSPPPASGPASRPASASATVHPTSGPASAPSEPPILVDRAGNEYFGGLTDLRVVSRSGARTDWSLPAAATGKGPAWLVRAPDGHLFLYNQPGRMLRIQPTLGGAEPFTIDATFTHGVPSVDRPTRIWLDPAGRIDMIWQDQLAIFFPTGYIPPAIASKMLTDQDD